MTENDINHEYCHICGEKLQFVRAEGSRLFYSCPNANWDNDHDRAVYVVGDDIETA